MALVRRLAGLLLVGGVLVLTATPAAAHTDFESSDPADGAVLEDPVDQLTLVFIGEAEPTGSGFEVLDPTGTVRTPAEATSVDGLTWVLRFDPPLAGGQIGVRWMVKAPDAHPIDGSFSFTVNSALVLPDAPVAETGPEATPTIDDGQRPVDLDNFLATEADLTDARRVSAVGRVISLTGTLIGVGALAFAAVVLRGARSDIRHVLYWVRRSGLLAVVGALVEFGAQAAVEGGGQWTALLSLSSVSAVLLSSFGVALALRVGGGLALASGARIQVVEASGSTDPVLAIRELVGVGLGGGGRSIDPTDVGGPTQRPGGVEPYFHAGDQAWLPTVDSAGAFAGGFALVASFLFDGHTVTKGDRFVTGLVDFVHIGGAAVWAGGLLMLTAVLWRRHRRGQNLRALQLAVRFSVLASGALVALGVAGIGLTVIILDSPSELWTTPWGGLLGLKIFFVLLAALAGAYNHNTLIPQMSMAPNDEALSHQFRAVVAGEAVALSMVIIVTGLLVGAAS